MTSAVRSLTIFFLSCNVLWSGCGDSGAQHQGRVRETSHLRSLISLYNYATTSLHHVPRDEEEFQQFLASEGQELLQRLKVNSVAELLTSERDGEKFVVLYAHRPSGVSGDVVAYEKVGVDGLRLVGFELGRIQEVDEATLTGLVPTAVTTEGVN